MMSTMFKSCASQKIKETQLNKTRYILNRSSIKSTEFCIILYFLFYGTLPNDPPHKIPAGACKFLALIGIISCLRWVLIY